MTPPDPSSPDASLSNASLPDASLPGASLPDWPAFGLVEDVRPAMAASAAKGNDGVLVTLARADGGAPRPPGAQMWVTREGPVGFLSGGCVEGDVVAHALQVLGDGRPRTLVYGEGSPWPDIRLLCGARIELLAERVRAGDPAVAGLLRAEGERRPALWLTDGARRVVARADGPTPPGPWRLGRRHDPRLRLVVVGGDPTALATAELAVRMGCETHLVRPRGPQAPPPIPGLTYHRNPPERALDGVALDPWTAVAVATHDLEVDEAALTMALASSAGYVGVLGARRRIPERRARLKARGLDEAALARLHAPIGLDLGGKAPFEIAVAILAEITALRHAAAPPLLLAPIGEAHAVA